MELLPTFHCLRNAEVISLWFLHNGFDCGIIDLVDTNERWRYIRKLDENELADPNAALDFERIDRHASEKIQSLKASSKTSTD